MRLRRNRAGDVVCIQDNAIVVIAFNSGVQCACVREAERTEDESDNKLLHV